MYSKKLYYVYYQGYHVSCWVLCIIYLVNNIHDKNSLPFLIFTLWIFPVCCIRGIMAKENWKLPAWEIQKDKDWLWLRMCGHEEHCNNAWSIGNRGTVGTGLRKMDDDHLKSHPKNGRRLSYNDNSWLDIVFTDTDLSWSFQYNVIVKQKFTDCNSYLFLLSLRRDSDDYLKWWDCSVRHHLEHSARLVQCSE